MSRQIDLEVKNLKKYYPVRGKKELKAVDDVSFTIYRGETFGIVGESGCGKTTCGKTCIGMIDKTDGEVLYQGQSVHELSKKERFDFTKKVQMIFQDPYSSLDPHQKVYDIICEGIRVHKLAKNSEEERKRVYELLEMVGLNAEHAMRNVHEFSGGQRQRIGIARALSVNPEFLFCDEPVSALDVSIQAQIVNLLMDLQKENDLTLMFISHDLSIVRHISDRIGVMYLGKMVEIADSDDFYENALHPYSKALLSVVPVANPEIAKTREQDLLSGDVPSPIDSPNGCRFCSRCTHCMPICKECTPKLQEISEGHYVACHLYGGEK